jgi:hypothetical protein
MIATDASQNDRIELGSQEANIPRLAIEAANELDELVEGRPTGLDAVKRLAVVLKRSFQIDQSGEKREAFVDSGTVAVFSQAVDEVAAGAHITTISELVARAVEIVKGLEDSISNSENQGLKKMRDFCIALSNAAAAYQQSIDEMQPSHPFRS